MKEMKSVKLLIGMIDKVRATGDAVHTVLEDEAYGVTRHIQVIYGLSTSDSQL